VEGGVETTLKSNNGIKIIAVILLFAVVFGYLFSSSTTTTTLNHLGAINDNTNNNRIYMDSITSFTNSLDVLLDRTQLFRNNKNHRKGPVKASANIKEPVVGISSSYDASWANSITLIGRNHLGKFQFLIFTSGAEPAFPKIP
jgi:hypothetical protein